MSLQIDTIDRALHLPVVRGEPHACTYLPDRTATFLYAYSPRIDSDLYQRLLDRGYRRSGQIYYRTNCASCRACVQMRVPVAEFRPSRSQRRAWRRNGDVEVGCGPPVCDDERFGLMQRYQRHQHDGQMCPTHEDLEEFLYRSPIDTIEMTYRIRGRLAGVGLVDVCPLGLSSVYFYFAPEFADRSLGVFSALREIEECRLRGLPYWYLGYYIADCRKMSYKASYRPHELLGDDLVWRRA